MSELDESGSMPKVKHVYVALNAAMGDLAEIGVAKNQQNRDQGWSFRGIDDVYDALSRVLVRNKLLILPSIEDRITDERPVSERTTRNKSIQHHIVLRVRYDFVSAVDGSSFSIVSHGEALDMGDKATSKALSMAYKYMALETFCIPLQGIQDGDLDTVPESVADPDARPEPPKVKTVKAAPKKKVTAASDDKPITDEITASQIRDMERKIQAADDKGDDAGLATVARAVLWAEFAPIVKNEMCANLMFCRANHVAAGDFEKFEKMCRVFETEAFVTQADADAAIKAAKERLEG